MTRTTPEPIPPRADVYFDVLCPWSFIAKRRLEKALSTLPHADRVEIVWRSFELSPQSRKTPGPTAAEEMTEWWGDRTAARIDLIRRLGAAEGLELNLHKARPVDTFDAHRLFHLATAHGRSDHMLEHLLTAYHTDGLNIADPRVLEHLGTRAGLELDHVRALLPGTLSPTRSGPMRRAPPNAASPASPPWCSAPDPRSQPSSPRRNCPAYWNAA
ncbi:DsbA family oxidoreductase [Actinomadura sp. 7K534]|uniref:DsbA family oxidoreductase n=1 Tax=Actinomadura sp. 7K534 TaxID=2530366 RepID=UPI001A9D42A7|nr:DsbA family oxidoreductase [Actinomadura sp. 7K534]